MSKQSRASGFRKIALSIWQHHGDPSVYSFVELDVTGIETKSSLLPLVIKALGATMNKNSELHSMIRWGQIELRKDKSISVMVNIPGREKDDLSALNLEDTHVMSVEEIQKRTELKAVAVRERRDPHLGPILNLIQFVPGPLLKTMFNLYELLVYEFNTRLGMSFLPHKPFGSIIVSNVGSLGIKNALLPLVPLARAAAMVSVGKITPQPRCVNGVICVREVVQLGITFDHRLFDGSHAARMLADFESYFYSRNGA